MHEAEVLLPAGHNRAPESTPEVERGSQDHPGRDVQQILGLLLACRVS